MSSSTRTALQALAMVFGGIALVVTCATVLMAVLGESDAGVAVTALMFVLLGALPVAVIVRLRNQEERIALHAFKIVGCGILMAFFGCLGTIAIGSERAISAGFLVAFAIYVLTLAAVFRFIRKQRHEENRN
jgi:hypothetical protein